MGMLGLPMFRFEAGHPLFFKTFIYPKVYDVSGTANWAAFTVMWLFLRGNGQGAQKP